MSATDTPTVTRVAGDLMPVNSYIVEGPSGLVVVDGQLTVSDAAKVRRAIDAHDTPVAGMVLTHGHPDHYAGAAHMLDGLDAPIIATDAVDEVIRRDDAEKDGIVGPMMGDEWPTERRFPDETVKDGASVMLGGLELAVTSVGPGESHHDTLWALDESTVFSGDVVYSEMHAYLADGRFAGWLESLAHLQRTFPEDVRLMVGHGEPTGRAALDRQRAYVEAFVDAVDANREAGEQERHDAVVRRMREILPTDDLLFLMELSIEPVLAAIQES